jgi:hypothetical protein
MRIAHLFRRLFVKTALAGAAGTLIPRNAIGAGPAGGEAQPVAKNALCHRIMVFLLLFSWPWIMAFFLSAKTSSCLVARKLDAGSPHNPG